MESKNSKDNTINTSKLDKKKLEGVSGGSFFVGKEEKIIKEKIKTNIDQSIHKEDSSISITTGDIGGSLYMDSTVDSDNETNVTIEFF